MEPDKSMHRIKDSTNLLLSGKFSLYTTFLTPSSLI